MMKHDPCKFTKCPKRERCIDYDMSCYRCKVYKAYQMGVEDGEKELNKKIAETMKEAEKLKETVKRMSNTIDEMQEAIDYFNEEYCGRQ